MLGIGILCLLGAGAMFRLLNLSASFAAGVYLFTLTSVGAMLCLPALAALRQPRAKLARAVTSVSRWSYAMYLVNIPIFMWLEREAGRALEDPFTAAIAAITGLALTVYASALLHYTFEMPILRWRDRRMSASPKTGAGFKRPRAELCAPRISPSRALL